jgi:multiple sugar transport system ATP-binding protein
MGDVTLDHLTKRYGDVVAVEDLDIHVEDGEFVTFVGPSGCGKSTSLEMVAGLTKPTEGRVSVAGRDVTDLPPKDRGVAMVFQNIALFPHMDVFDNVSFGLRLRDYDRDEIERRVKEATRIVQMEGMSDRMPDELSGGQRQRVAIARAIVREPEVFLMDEPLANLDAKLRVHMRTELQRLHKRLDATIVYVTHDQEEAMTMSDRIAVMNAGRLQQFAPPLACYNRPANEFVAGFIGSPSMNFFSGEVRDGRVETPHFDVDLGPDRFGLGDGDRVTLGVRPENVVPIDGVDDVGSPSAEIQAYTDVVEPLGDEILVYLRFDRDPVDAEDADRLLMRVPPDPVEADRDEGEPTAVAFDRERVHLFDAETGEAITHGLTETAVAPDRSIDREADAVEQEADGVGQEADS